MATTSVKLPNELKARAAAAAKARGISTHAFLVDAIGQTVDAAERRAQFVSDAVAARDQALASNLGIPATNVHDYLRDKTRGKPATRPNARAWRE